MITDTLLGLVAFAASAGPGYLFVLLAERREPRHDRSPLQEAAELILVGGIATTIGLLVSLGVWEAAGLIDTGALAGNVGHYLLAHPLRGLIVLLTALILSYGGVWLLAAVVFEGSADIRPSDSAWYGAFRRQVPKDYGVLVTVSLRDGRALTGAVGGFTVPPERDREILLTAPRSRPIYMQDADGNVHALSDTFMIIQSSEILYVSGIYEPIASPSGS